MLGPHDLEEYFGLLEEPREETATAAKTPRTIPCPICNATVVRHHLPFPFGQKRRVA